MGGHTAYALNTGQTAFRIAFICFINKVYALLFIMVLKGRKTLNLRLCVSCSYSGHICFPGKAKFATLIRCMPNLAVLLHIKPMGGYVTPKRMNRNRTLAAR